ncbi:hypothetical protein ANN_23922 [Periplaneta americana]|uniref:Enkurin domain-containing protein n=1 Tax=Periplaneta americana TaxID=6978 RepID=A0ABQ8S1N2_PERAM|nr:hypothetical protein ANN_23922 [Periplaneta americana]
MEISVHKTKTMAFCGKSPVRSKIVIGKSIIEQEDKSPLLFPPHSTLEAGPWMGGVKPDQTRRIVPQLQRFKRKLKARENTGLQKPDPARAILASGTNFTAEQVYIHHKPDPARAILASGTNFTAKQAHRSTSSEGGRRLTDDCEDVKDKKMPPVTDYEREMLLKLVKTYKEYNSIYKINSKPLILIPIEQYRSEIRVLLMEQTKHFCCASPEKEEEEEEEEEVEVQEVEEVEDELEEKVVEEEEAEVQEVEVE